MYNHDLLNKMIDKFGVDKTTEFAEMVSFMHDVLYQEAKTNGPDEITEHNFERDWWKNTHKQLKNEEICIAY
jgi:hypothetical protein